MGDQVAVIVDSTAIADRVVGYVESIETNGTITHYRVNFGGWVDWLVVNELFLVSDIDRLIAL